MYIPSTKVILGFPSRSFMSFFLAVKLLFVADVLLIFYS